MLPSQPELSALMAQGAGDRAFVDGMLRLEWGRGTHSSDELRELHRELQLAADTAHAALRAQLRTRSLGAKALRELFDAVPPLERDHFVEEVLGIAYPPLSEPEFRSAELMTYTPSGYDEIVHAFDATGLDAAARFLDVGSGLGKVTMLASLLTGATSTGVEIDAGLCSTARAAAFSLGLERVAFQQADARDLAEGGADVIFMYLPFAGDTLHLVLTRLVDPAREPSASPEPARVRYLCAGALDLTRYPQLQPAAPPRSWLNVYAWR